jgi:hypothetical protein
MGIETSRTPQRTQGPVDPGQAPKRTHECCSQPRVMQIDAVTLCRAARQSRDTRCRTTAWRPRPWAAKALFLAQSGNKLGDFLGLGELKSAAVQTQHFDLLMYDSKQHYLGIAVATGNKLDAVEAEIRAALVPGR